MRFEVVKIGDEKSGRKPSTASSVSFWEVEERKRVKLFGGLQEYHCGMICNRIDEALGGGVGLKPPKKSPKSS